MPVARDKIEIRLTTPCAVSGPENERRRSGSVSLSSGRGTCLMDILRRTSLWGRGAGQTFSSEADDWLWRRDVTGLEAGLGLDGVRLRLHDTGWGVTHLALLNLSELNIWGARRPLHLPSSRPPPSQHSPRPPRPHQAHSTAPLTTLQRPQPPPPPRRVNYLILYAHPALVPFRPSRLARTPRTTRPWATSRPHPPQPLRPPPFQGTLTGPMSDSPLGLVLLPPGPPRVMLALTAGPHRTPAACPPYLLRPTSVRFRPELTPASDKVTLLPLLSKRPPRGLKSEVTQRRPWPLMTSPRYSA